MNCKPDKKVAKAAYDRERYANRKAAHEAVYGPKTGPNQWTVYHRMTGSSEYKSWQAMRRRCTRQDDKDWSNYGGRGIKVCPEWEDFSVFYADMGPRPNGTSIERRDNSVGYSKGNCYWATPTEQTRNRRNAINVTLNGVTKPLTVWCNEIGINYYTAHRKLRREGRTPEEVFA